MKKTVLTLVSFFIINLALYLTVSASLIAQNNYTMKGNRAGIGVAENTVVLDSLTGKKPTTVDRPFAADGVLIKGTKLWDPIEFQVGDSVILCWKTTDKGLLIVGLSKAKK
ncbi:MAG: hypothetical protein V1930_08160 [Pseudomonadota bacterium]